MFELRKGNVVPFPDELKEEYELSDNEIIANVSSSKIEMILAEFISMNQEEPVFFILEVPSNEADEREAGKLHKDVYYIDGCSANEALTILDKTIKVLRNDGLCNFGFGCHESHDEIMFCKYNVTIIYSNDTNKYISLFEEHQIKRTQKLITAWDTFTANMPGESRRIKTDGKDIYSIIEDLKEWNIYKAEQREE